MFGSSSSMKDLWIEPLSSGRISNSEMALKAESMTKESAMQALKLWDISIGVAIQ